MSKFTVIRLNAGMDSNGNPRRVYVVIERYLTVVAYDEGYLGVKAVTNRHHRRAALMCCTFETTVKEYKAVLKWYGGGGIMSEAQKPTTEAYRDGYDRVFRPKKVRGWSLRRIATNTESGRLKIPEHSNDCPYKKTRLTLNKAACTCKPDIPRKKDGTTARLISQIR